MEGGWHTAALGEGPRADDAPTPASQSFADFRSSIVRAYIANARAGAQRQVLPIHHLATLNTITSLWLENRPILDRPLLAQANEVCGPRRGSCSAFAR